jgi:hypothetical protein
MREAWTVEEIPDPDMLYMRVQRRWFGTDGELDLGCFRNQPDEQTGAMSTDWSKYSTAGETRQRTRSPRDNAVIELRAGDIRQIPNQRVEHSPTEDNRAHTGPKRADPQVRRLYSRIYRMVLPL